MNAASRVGRSSCSPRPSNTRTCSRCPASGVIDQVRSGPDTLVELLGEFSGRLTAIDGEFQSSVSDSVLVRLGAKLWLWPRLRPRRDWRLARSATPLQPRSLCTDAGSPSWSPSPRHRQSPEARRGRDCGASTDPDPPARNAPVSGRPQPFGEAREAATEWPGRGLDVHVMAAVMHP